MKLKVGTYNICHCRDFSDFDPNGPEKEAVCHLDKTANVIKNLDCDILSLNEVFASGIWKEFENQTEVLASLSGYKHYNFALGADLSLCVIGNSILSKYPILKFEQIAIPTVPENQRDPNGYYEDRVLAICDIDVNGQLIKVISAHFGLMPAELKNCVQAVCEVLDCSTIPCILMGDFNAEPNNPALIPIFDRLKNSASQMNNFEKTFSTYAPSILIDYIFVPKRATVFDYKVEKEYKVSDHYPITSHVDI